MLKIIKSPSKYIQGFDTIKQLNDYFEIYGQKGAYILIDPFIYDNFKDDILSSFVEKGTKHHVEIFTKECSQIAIDANIKKIKELDYDVIFCIGGGKTIDTGKAVGHFTRLPFVVVPTVASSDAPCSALSVVYTEDGEFEKYLFLNTSPTALVLDTNIIVNAPARLLSAGIGDALATYYEANACYQSNATSIAGGKPSKTAIALAKLCLDTLLEDGLKAVKSCEDKVVTSALENIIEANTYLSGVGFESGGLAAAHAIHNGLTALHECHHMFHGEKVAFGTITQLVLENRSLHEIEKIIMFCKSVNLPVCFRDLGITELNKEKLMEVAELATAEGETIHNMPFKVTAYDVYAALLTANQLGEHFSK